MSIVKFDEIDIGKIWKDETRQRELGSLESLKASIQKQGLLQPIVVTSELQLAAGERRLTACRELEHTKIMAKILPPGISADDLVIIEMVENTERKAFLWHEEIYLKLKLHNIWMTEAKQLGDSWGYRQTAKKLGVSLGGLSTDLDLARAIQTFPTLKDVDSKAKAREMFKKMVQQAEAIESLENLPKAERERLKEMSQGNIQKASKKKPKKNIPKALHEDTELNPESLACSTVEHPEEPLETEEDSSLPDHVYYIGSYEDFLKQIPTASVGLIELDPPYAIDYNVNYDSAKKQKPKATDWTAKTLYTFYEKYLPILYEKLLDNSWTIIWTGKEHFKTTNEIAKVAGFKTQEPGVWTKPGGSSNTPKTNMTSCYEMFLLLRKGKPTFNIPSVMNVWQFAPAHSSVRIHQWEKPIELCKYVVKILGRPNAICLSPFAGSGNMLIAAALAGMLPMGCDLEEKYLHLFYKNFQNYYF